jgi:predicted nucleotide-binding protein (sugar kinase/HSP70/actin superfamily)
MRVGIPSALVTPYYITFWRSFFENLGVEVVETGPTTKAILNRGIRYAVPDICVPIKTYLGHVATLFEAGVDYIYTPRFVTIRKGDTFCPKFLGLPEMLQYSIPGLESRLLVHSLEAQNDNIATEKNYLKLGLGFIKERARVRESIVKAGEAWQSFRNLCVLDGYNCRQANQAVMQGVTTVKKEFPLKIGVLGYVYNVYDDIIGMDILGHLNDLGAAAVTFEMIRQKRLEKKLQSFPKNLFWTFSNKLWASAYHFREDPTIDGIIHVTAFGCGPDSFLGKMLELDPDFDKPFMTLRVDEHSGENHLLTRLEAFIHMVTKQKGREGGLKR